MIPKDDSRTMGSAPKGVPVQEGEYLFGLPGWFCRYRGYYLAFRMGFLGSVAIWKVSLSKREDAFWPPGYILSVPWPSGWPKSIIPLAQRSHPDGHGTDQKTSGRPENIPPFGQGRLRMATVPVNTFQEGNVMLLNLINLNLKLLFHHPQHCFTVPGPPTTTNQAAADVVRRTLLETLKKSAPSASWSWSVREPQDERRVH